MNLVEQSHKLVWEFWGGARAQCAVDATLGRGRDALFAASIVKDNGTVYGFDIQQAAVRESQALFEKGRQNFYDGINSGKNVCAKFFCSSHSQMEKFIDIGDVGNVGAFFFNLGWLPTSDKSVVTRADTTLSALEASLRLAGKSKCALSVLSYRGHSGAQEEFECVKNFFEGNVKNFSVFGDIENPLSPILFFAGLNV